MVTELGNGNKMTSRADALTFNSVWVPHLLRAVYYITDQG
jgi:hypothetical protein